MKHVSFAVRYIYALMNRGAAGAKAASQYAEG